MEQTDNGGLHNEEQDDDEYNLNSDNIHSSKPYRSSYDNDKKSFRRQEYEKHLSPSTSSALTQDNDADNISEHANQKITKNLAFAIMASTLGASFQHGYNGGVVNAPEKLISQFINTTFTERNNQVATDSQIDLIFAIIVSVFCIGGFMGALATATVAERFGRKDGLLLNNALVLIAAPLMFASRSFKSYELLIAGRLIIGINAGLNAGLAPLYINDIAPARLRGSLGSIYQLVITSSIFLSNVLGLPNFLGTEDAWPLLFAVPLVAAAFMLLTLPHCPESPNHLIKSLGKELEAQRALSWLRQTGDVQDEMEALLLERERQQSDPSITLSKLINNRQLRKPMLIATVIMLSQQLSGINAVLFFSASIFRSAGYGEDQALRTTLGLSLTNVLFTIVSMLLVERIGRKKLQLTGLMGMAIACVVLAICLPHSESQGYLNTRHLGPSINVTFHQVSMISSSKSSSFALSPDIPTTNFIAITKTHVEPAHNLTGLLTTASEVRENGSPFAMQVAIGAMYVFIIMFASGPGSIPWFMVTELFPSSARSLATSIAVSVNWLANFVVLLSFLPLTNLLHGYTFLLFATLLLFFFVFTYLKIPETKGASAEEIEALFETEQY